MSILRTIRIILLLTMVWLTLSLVVFAVSDDLKSLYIETSASREFKGADEMIILTGLVKDDLGESVSNVEISVQVNDSFNSSVHVLFTYTNENGTFRDEVNLGPRPALGNYTIYVTANKPGFQRGYARLRFSVSPKHFEITVSPTLQKILGGEDTVYNIFISSVGRLDVPIVIAVTGMPNESTYALSSSSITPPANVTLIIKTEPEIQTGSYNITVSGSSAIGSRETYIHLIVMPQKPTPAPLWPFYLIAGIGGGFLVFGLYARTRKRKKEREVPETPEEKPDKMYYVEGLPLPSEVLVSLPDHLRKTAMILCHMDEATAHELSEKTGRARAVESSYLNQLVSMGHVKKRRRGRRVYFYVER